MTRRPYRGGAYGFRICGLPPHSGQLVDAPEHWPALTVRVRVGGSFASACAPTPDRLSRDSAQLHVLSGGSVSVDRSANAATFSMPTAPSTAALLHPHLAAVAAVASHWLGRDSFHAGAFVADGGVWGVLGEKGAGKSSLLAAMACAGVPIVCDDMLVLDGLTALAGPRSVDLRAEAAERLGTGQPLGMVGGRERWRVELEPVAPELPLRGWITLRWGRDSAVGVLKGSARLRALLRHQALRVPSPEPGRAIALSSRPVLEFARPKRWGELDRSVGHLLEALLG